ncbi:hypothetical protein [Bosea sp. (in: a-proteobacteria)]|uniref:hypothetical protein n=1 Tax=Bosea sp. (in: a-proteobacteria) TaxID=1871050 RepID=UPI003564CC17
MIARAFSPLRRFVAWFFGHRAAGLDLTLAAPAAGWAALLQLRPDMFERGNWAAISLLPARAWLAIMLALAVTHCLCLARPARLLRVAAAAASAWVWLFIAWALARNGVTPGTLIHAELGLLALLGGLHVFSLPEERA